MFGQWSIDKELFDFIIGNLDKGKTILEFGSGDTSNELNKHYNLYSIEEDKIWASKYHNQYILAPIRNGWYDVDIIKQELPSEVDLILVDGPARAERIGLFKNKELIMDLNFKWIIFDDIERANDYKVYQSFINYYKDNGVPFETEVKTYKKSFGYIKL